MCPGLPCTVLHLNWRVIAAPASPSILLVLSMCNACCFLPLFCLCSRWVVYPNTVKKQQSLLWLSFQTWLVFDWNVILMSADCTKSAACWWIGNSATLSGMPVCVFKCLSRIKWKPEMKCCISYICQILPEVKVGVSVPFLWVSSTIVAAIPRMS